MGKLIRIPQGKRFGKLKYIGEAGNHILPCGYKQRMIRVECDCGKVLNMFLSNVLRSKNKTCGCVRDEDARKRMTTHGMSKTRTYKSWLHMKERCNNPSNKRFGDYGGRGIKVCKRWDKFENFFDDMGEAPLGKSIDRINNDGDYCLENCRWADKFEQGRNKRNNIVITYNGESRVLSEWSEITKIPYYTLNKRIESGMPLSDALDPNFGKILYNGNYYTIAGLCSKYKVAKTTFYARRRRGWSINDILFTKPKTRPS